MKEHEYIQIGDKIRIACVNYSVALLNSVVYTTKINHHLLYANNPDAIIMMKLKIEEANLGCYAEQLIDEPLSFWLNECTITNRPADYFPDIKQQVTPLQNFNFCRCEQPQLIWNEALGKPFQVCKICGNERV